MLQKLIRRFREVLFFKMNLIFTVISSVEGFVLQCGSSYGRHQPYKYKSAVFWEVTPFTWKNFIKVSQKSQPKFSVKKLIPFLKMESQYISIRPHGVLTQTTVLKLVTDLRNSSFTQFKNKINKNCIDKTEFNKRT